MQKDVNYPCDMKEQLVMVRKAYDATVELHKRNVDSFSKVPEEFKNSPEFKLLMKECGPELTGSACPDIKAFLKPQSGMRFLDVGSCANLANYRLDEWPSTYYGVDISPALVNLMKTFVSREKIKIGGLHVADIAHMPFNDSFFDICAVIGVFEYCTLDYIKKSLAELQRVMKPNARMVVDIPNPEHPSVNTMMCLEEYVGRPNILHARSALEELLAHWFEIECADDSRVMLKYFVRTRTDSHSERSIHNE